MATFWPWFEQLKGLYLNLDIFILKEFYYDLGKSCFDHLWRELSRKVKKLCDYFTGVNSYQGNRILAQGLKVGQNGQNLFCRKLLHKSAQTFHSFDSDLVFEVPQKSTENWEKRILTDFLSKCLGKIRKHFGQVILNPPTLIPSQLNHNRNNVLLILLWIETPSNLNKTFETNNPNRIRVINSQNLKLLDVPMQQDLLFDILTQTSHVLSETPP